MRRLPALCLAILVVGITVSADAKNYGVSARDSFFSKAFVVIRAGDSVTWRNDGAVEHTVTSFPDAPAEFSSSSSRQCVPAPLIGNDPDDCMDPGHTFRYPFAQPGTYDYYCKVHGSFSQRPDNRRSEDDQPCGMCGRVVAKAVKTPSPSTEPTRSETKSPSPSASPSDASQSPSPSPSETTDGSDGEPSGDRGDDAGRGIGRGTVALLGIVALSGAGWWTWRRYLTNA